MRTKAAVGFDGQRLVIRHTSVDATHLASLPSAALTTRVEAIRSSVEDSLKQLGESLPTRTLGRPRRDLLVTRIQTVLLYTWTGYLPKLDCVAPTEQEIASDYQSGDSSDGSRELWTYAVELWVALT
jgi:hypothetical protein